MNILNAIVHLKMSSFVLYEFHPNKKCFKTSVTPLTSLAWEKKAWVPFSAALCTFRESTSSTAFVSYTQAPAHSVLSASFLPSAYFYVMHPQLQKQDSSFDPVSHAEYHLPLSPSLATNLPIRRGRAGSSLLPVTRLPLRRHPCHHPNSKTQA